jgi:drug/metabolite transporter (DMT)-like permease
VVPLLLPALFVLLWSSGYVGGAWGVSAGDVFALLAARFVIAAAVSAPLALRRRSALAAPVPWGRLTIIAVFLLGVQFGCGYTALQQGVHPAVSALIMLGLSPLLSTAASQLLGHERPGSRVWIALAIGCAGTAISALPQIRGAEALGWPLLLTLLGMLGLVIGSLLQKQWATHVDTRVSVAVQSLVGAAIFVPLAVATGATDVSDPLPFWLSALWLGAASTAAAVALQIALLKRHALSRVTGLLLAVPPVTALLSYVLLDRPIALLTVVGMPIALGAVWTVLRRPAALTDARS